MLFQPILKRGIDAGLPAFASGAKALHHIWRKPDRHWHFRGRFLRPALSAFTLELGQPGVSHGTFPECSNGLSIVWIVRYIGRITG